MPTALPLVIAVVRWQPVTRLWCGGWIGWVVPYPILFRSSLSWKVQAWASKA